MTQLPIVPDKDPEIPVLLATEIPHPIRHGAILGALGQLTPGTSMILVAPHNPIPLLAQIDEQFGESMLREYLVEGPQDWHLKFTRV